MLSLRRFQPPVWKPEDPGYLLPRARVPLGDPSDERAVTDDTIHPAGAREDRPLYVYREMPVAPDDHSASRTSPPLRRAMETTTADRSVPS